ncbi:MAG TPA: hypothetical protein PLQ95_04405 [Thiobacillus sp.]|nr:hypothetical protein [Thiobacillus sp.]
MADLIESAPMLDVCDYSEHKTVLGVVSYFVDEVIKPPRKDRATHWKNVRMLITDLWLAAKASNNPWRSFSRDKSAYSDGTRNAGIYITFALVGVVDRLISLGYIEQVKGKYNPATGWGRISRIKATDKLLDLIKIRDIYSVPTINPEIEKPAVILKDEEKRVIAFEENGRTNEIKVGMLLLNKLYAATRIEVSRKALETDGFVQLTDKSVFRSFNNSDFWAGGRICGGVWQAVEREYRKTITIEGEAVTELDYKANHPSMMYRLFTGAPIPEDCYAVPGYERDLLKLAMMRMLNNNSKEAATKSVLLGIKKENIKRKRKGRKLLPSLSKDEAVGMIEALENLHTPILEWLYNKDHGYTLQSLEGEIAVDITLTLMRQDIVCLPVHDSFIVQTKHQEQLKQQMIESYKKYLNQTPTIDIKY